MSGWLLRIDGDVVPTWWCGPAFGQLGSFLVADALLFDTPADCRDAMRSVGWRPGEPGWIVPLRIAVAQAVPVQSRLFAL